MLPSLIPWFCRETTTYRQAPLTLGVSGPADLALSLLKPVLSSVEFLSIFLTQRILSTPD